MAIAPTPEKKAWDRTSASGPGPTWNSQSIQLPGPAMNPSMLAGV
jgi:hypothetical protein